MILLVFSGVFSSEKCEAHYGLRHFYKKADNQSVVRCGAIRYLNNDTPHDTPHGKFSDLEKN